MWNLQNRFLRKLNIHVLGRHICVALCVLFIGSVVGCASHPRKAELINLGDCLLLSFRLPGLAPETYVVDAAGDISLSDIGKVHVAGLTSEQAEGVLHDRYLFAMRPVFVSISKCPQ